jgi:hypothetical protein
MNYLKSSGLSLLFLLFAAPAFTQSEASINNSDQTKPFLFSGFPDRIAVDINDLKTVFSDIASKGTNVAIKFADQTLPGFKGETVSTASKYNNSIQSVVIRSTQFNGATLTLSSSTATDGAARYTGRIISFQHADMYVLVKENGKYYFIKKKYDDIINE